MLNPIFGTAHLFGLVSEAESMPILRGAHEAGFQHFDTAPSYGFGRCEPALGEFLTDLAPAPAITSKTGIRPLAEPPWAVKAAKGLARQLPENLQRRLRGGGTSTGHGNFQPADVQASVELSLRRLGRLDRLVLHEVAPRDITEELLSCLSAYVERGDVGQLGVATANELTAACLSRAPQTFQVAHFSVGPLSPPVELPGTVTVRVGHGIFGPGALHLKQLQARLDSEPGLGDEWRETTAGTRWQGSAGLADALLARSCTLGLTDVILATARVQKLPATRALVLGEDPLAEPVLALLNRLIEGV